MEYLSTFKADFEHTWSIRAMYDPVDGRNPAPPWIVETHTGINHPSTGNSDFFHPQYVRDMLFFFINGGNPLSSI